MWLLLVQVVQARGNTVSNTLTCTNSTVFSLLCRLYECDTGSIRIDNYNVKELNTTWLRSQIAVVPQEPFLFACSIYDNICYGKPNATREQVEQACKMAHAHDFIMSFPQGYETQVGGMK